jgi:hypothetical protein
MGYYTGFARKNKRRNNREKASFPQTRRARRENLTFANIVEKQP